MAMATKTRTATTTIIMICHLLLLLALISTRRLSTFFVAAYSSGDFHGYCNLAHIKDDHPLEQASKNVLQDLATGTPTSGGFRLCTAATVEGFTQHGSASCSGGLGTEGCAGCLDSARGFLLATCGDRLGGRTFAGDGLCYMRFENYVYCDV